jgi:hypothetical protein
LAPFRTQSPLSRLARVFRLATSEPESGSDMAIASVPPFTTRPRRSRFCSSLPKRFSAPTTISVTP